MEIVFEIYPEYCQPCCGSSNGVEALSALFVMWYH